MLCKPVTETSLTDRMIRGKLLEVALSAASFVWLCDKAIIGVYGGLDHWQWVRCQAGNKLSKFSGVLEYLTHFLHTCFIIIL